jgi:hypothetical protein
MMPSLMIPRLLLIISIFLFSFSNLSGEQQANNAFYNCIDSAPDIPDAKAVPLGLDMVNKNE